MSERRDWSGASLTAAHCRVHAAFDVARQTMLAQAAADRAFGGDGSADFDDPASHMAFALSMLERELRNLAGDISLGHLSSETVKDTANAILDWLPASFAPTEENE